MNEDRDYTVRVLVLMIMALMFYIFIPQNIVSTIQSYITLTPPNDIIQSQDIRIKNIEFSHNGTASSDVLYIDVYTTDWKSTYNEQDVRYIKLTDSDTSYISIETKNGRLHQTYLYIGKKKHHTLEQKYESATGEKLRWDDEIPS